MGVDAVIRFKLDNPLTDKEMNLVGYQLRSAFRKYIWRQEKDIFGEKNYGIRRVTADWFGDEPEGNWYQVSTGISYYGPGYERGPLMTILGIATFLEALFPNTPIYYGGDSDDNYPVLDEQKKKELLDHFIKVQHIPYNSAFGRDKRVECPFCEQPMSPRMFSGNRVGYDCTGCNTKAEVIGDSEPIFTIGDD